MKINDIIEKIEKECNVILKKLTVLDDASPSYIIRENKLAGLSLSHSKIENLNTICSILKDCTALAELNLSYNEISDVSNLKNLKEVKELNLSYNEIVDISPLNALKNLVKINLSKNKVANIDSLQDLEYLEELNLQNNNLVYIYSLGKINSLITLDISENLVENISFLNTLKKIATLNLSQNHITDISPLSKLKDLSVLNLNFNPIVNIATVKELQSIEELTLPGNTISDVTPITNLKKLKRFYFQGGNLKEINFLKYCKELTEVYISNHHISDVSALKGLSELNIVVLNENEISDISSLRGLKNLKRVDLMDNPITKIPEWITEFNLEIKWSTTGKSSCITFFNSPIDSPPIEIMVQGKQAIANYFEQMKYEKDFLFEAKLLLVGEERSGKSTLSDALRRIDFEIDPLKLSTHGITISKWFIDKSKVNTPKNFCFNIWDFGGQEIYHSTHQFFLTKRSLYLFVTEVRKDLRYDDFYYWLNIINTLAGDSPVLLVQNKIDQNHRNQSLSEYHLIFPQIAGTVQKISCNTQHEDWELIFKPSIEILKETIYNIIKGKKLNGVGDELPKPWVNIRKEINVFQDQGINFISQTLYFNICAQYGLNQEQSLYLSDYFHDLGVFLHFRNDIQLKNTIFLDHFWVTKAIYNVLDNKKVKDAHGKFTDLDLIEIWSEPEFVEKQSELINLMKNPQFKICYQHEDKYYLAPQLFKDEYFHFYWDYKENLNFRYNYEFMPKGILSQLIVIMHRYVDNNWFWLHGVFFKYKSSRALVREDRFSKNNLITIQIRGEFKKDLLSIIISNIETIHSNYTNLKVVEEFGCNCLECSQLEVPHYYATKTINMAIKKGKRVIECQISFDPVGINSFLGNYIPIEEVERHLARPNKDHYDRLDKILLNTEILKRHQIEIRDKLAEHYQFLISFPENRSHNVQIDEIIEKLQRKQSNEIIEAIMNFIVQSFEILDQELEDKLQIILKDLNKTDDWLTKVKLSIPLLNLVGLNIESEFDLNAFVKKFLYTL